MSSPGDSADKQELRKRFRARRRDLSPEQRTALDEQIRTHLAQGMANVRPREVSAFLAFDGEPDLLPLLLQLHEQGVRLALPVVPAVREGLMTLHAWNPVDSLAASVFGIREPKRAAHRPLDSIDVVLMPLVAFDRKGTRLGMGAGYYDRLLATGNQSGAPLRVGVAYQCQQAPELPREPWDVPLHAVVTEHGWFTCPA